MRVKHRRALACIAFAGWTGCAKATPPAAEPVAMAAPIDIADVAVEPEAELGGDESQPEYWLKKLEIASWRARVVTRLTVMFEDTVTNSSLNWEAPEVRRLVDK